MDTYIKQKKKQRHIHRSQVGSYKNEKVGNYDQDRVHGGGSFCIAKNDLLFDLGNCYMNAYSLFCMS